MKIVEKVKGFFKKDIAQTVDIESMVNSQVMQAGGDIIINQEFPADMMAILKNINEKLPQIKTLDQSDEKSEVSDIYTKLMERTLQEIRNRLDCGKFHDAKETIEQFIQTEGFNIIDTSWRIQIYFLHGIVLLEENEFEKLESVLIYINDLQQDSKYRFELIYRIACSKNDEKMFEEAMRGFRKINTTTEEIENKSTRFLIVQEKYDAVISNLTEFDEVKEAYVDNAEILYCLGIAYFNLREYSLARKYLAQSNDISNFEYKEYLLILSEAIPILNQKGIVALMTLEEKTILTKNLNDLLKLQDFFMARDITLKAEFWIHVFSIKTLINPSEAISDMEELPESLRQIDKMKYILGEAYALVGRTESAVEIFEEIYKVLPSSEILLKIVGICYEEKDYSKVVEILSDIDYEEYKDDEPISYILKFYFISYYKIKDCDSVSKKIEELESEFPDCAPLFESIAIYFYESGKIDKAKEYIGKAKSCIEKTNDFTRVFLAKTCKEIGMLDDAIEVLEPFKEYTKEGLETFIEILLETETEENLNRAEDLLNGILETGCREPKILGMKAKIAVQNADLTGAIKWFTELFEIVPNAGTAYNLIATKIQSREFNNIDEYINCLAKTEDPSKLMMGALGLDAIDKSEQAKNLAYNALYLMGDEIEETIYGQYLSLYFQNMPKASAQQEVTEFDKIKKDVVVELVDPEGNTRFICINSVNDFIKEEGHFAIGCEQYSSETNLNNRLLNLKIGDNAELQGIVYSVKSIVDKHTHAFRYCINRYTTSFPDSKFLKVVPVGEEDPFRELMPILIQQKERNEFLLQQYNSLEGIGIPSTMLCGDHGNYNEVINALLSMENQMFYSGKVDSLDTNNGRVILSFSSIVFLKHIGFLERVLKEKENIYTTEKTLNKIAEIFTGVCELGENTKGTMSIDAEGGLRYIATDEEDKEKTVEFWRDIVISLENIGVIKTNDNQHGEIKRSLRAIMGDFEFDPIFIEAHEEDILICDDLSIRKLIDLTNQQLKTTNSVGVLEEVCSPEDLLDITLDLAKQQYVYVCNKNTLLKIVDHLLTKPLIIGPGTDCDKFIGIIKNMFINQLLFIEYFPMLRDVIYEVFQRTMGVEGYSLLEQIIKEIKLSVGRLGIPSGVALEYLVAPASFDVRKAQFIIKVYENN
ncbi:PIN domain-containing protein [Bacillus cereus]|uniref:PIN domain-containing protein n=1 Tax=Bacillus cereus TaxID=1396 RepID=UPI00027C0FF5|nr:hypothetical protein [Bacillus cereus]EJV56397.1 hypothetical protein IEM_05279 [Bacillus cereus BAG6O-2]